jgi:hypothetical protein
VFTIGSDRSLVLMAIDTQMAMSGLHLRARRLPTLVSLDGAAELAQCVAGRGRPEADRLDV